MNFCVFRTASNEWKLDMGSWTIAIDFCAQLFNTKARLVLISLDKHRSEWIEKRSFFLSWPGVGLQQAAFTGRLMSDISPPQKKKKKNEKKRREKLSGLNHRPYSLYAVFELLMNVFFLLLFYLGNCHNEKSCSLSYSHWNSDSYRGDSQLHTRKMRKSQNLPYLEWFQWNSRRILWLSKLLSTRVMACRNGLRVRHSIACRHLLFGRLSNSPLHFSHMHAQLTMAHTFHLLTSSSETPRCKSQGPGSGSVLTSANTEVSIATQMFAAR